MDRARSGVQALAGIDLAGNVDEHRLHRRLEGRREMEGALVERADLAAGDALAFRAQADRLAAAAQAATGALEDAHATFAIGLIDSPEDADQVADQRQGRQLAQVTAQEEAGVGQAQRDDGEHVDAGGVVHDIDGLPGRVRRVPMHPHVQAPDAQHGAAARRQQPVRIQAPEPEQGGDCEGQHQQRAQADQQQAGGDAEAEQQVLPHASHTTVCMARFRRRSNSSTGASSNWPAKYG